MNTKRFLNPGGWYFGSGDVTVETLLGPCIAIVVWFPATRQGGICHFLLPGPRRVAEHARQLDGRYGYDAWVWLKQQARAQALRMDDAEIKLFGGARSLTNTVTRRQTDIGKQNIAFVEQLLAESGVKVIGRDLGGEGHRVLRFDLSSGDVWLRRGGALAVKARKEALK